MSEKKDFTRFESLVIKLSQLDEQGQRDAALMINAYIAGKAANGPKAG